MHPVALRCTHPCEAALWLPTLLFAPPSLDPCPTCGGSQGILSSLFHQAYVFEPSRQLYSPTNARLPTLGAPAAHINVCACVCGGGDEEVVPVSCWHLLSSRTMGP